MVFEFGNDYHQIELFERLYNRKYRTLGMEQREKYTYSHFKNVSRDYRNGYFKVQFDNGEWWCLFPLIEILKELNELFGDIEHYKTSQEWWFFRFKEVQNECLAVKKDDYSLWYQDYSDNSGGFHLYLFEINEWERGHYTYGTCFDSLPKVPRKVVEST